MPRPQQLKRHWGSIGDLKDELGQAGDERKPTPIQPSDMAITLGAKAWVMFVQSRLKYLPAMLSRGGFAHVYLGLVTSKFLAKFLYIAVVFTILGRF